MSSEPIIKQFDRVELLTTKNVNYLSAKPGSSPSTHGLWSVVGIIDNMDILISKEDALVRIPLKDVKKVENYDLSIVVDNLKKVRSYGKEENTSKEEREERLRKRFEIGN